MEDKFILDACCGPRCFWFNKNHPNALYIDNRVREKGYIWNRDKREVKPDLVADFRDMPFEDKSFKLVVFDPPHLLNSNKNNKENKSFMALTYGTLNPETWREDLKKGFDECWRVLEDYGVLIFKWNENAISKKEVLELFGKPYLFGHPVGSKISTHWFCFMKIPEELTK